MIKWSFIAVALLLIGLGLILLNVGSAGESRIEAWVGSQLKSIVNQGNRFTLEFGSIDYQSPNRVILTDLRLFLSESEGVPAPLIEIEKGTIDLAEVPRWGQPIVLRTVSLLKPTVRIETFMAAAKRENKRSRPATRTALSSILTLRQVEIVDGTVGYDDGKGSPLCWTNLQAKLDLETRDAQWHSAKVSIDQSPLVKATASAEIDLDTMIARAIDVDASVDLNDPAASRFFTPPLQRLLERYQVQGRGRVRASGRVDPRQRENTDVNASFELSQGHVSSGPYRLPIRSAHVTATLRGSRLAIESAEAQLLGGSVRASATFDRGGDQKVDAQAILAGVRLEELLDARVRSEPTALAGRVESDIRVHSTAPDLRRILARNSTNQAWGSGYVRISDGRLVGLPVIAQVMDVSRSVTGLLTGKAVNRDTFEAQFQIVDRSIDINDMLYRGDALAMRGKGRMGFHGDLDLVVNAGPLERLQESLGPVGTLWGKLSDRLMSYSVKGTRSEPVVRPMLGGR